MYHRGIHEKATYNETLPWRRTSERCCLTQSQRLIRQNLTSSRSRIISRTSLGILVSWAGPWSLTDRDAATDSGYTRSFDNLILASLLSFPAQRSLAAKTNKAWIAWNKHLLGIIHRCCCLTHNQRCKHCFPKASGVQISELAIGLQCFYESADAWETPSKSAWQLKLSWETLASIISLEPRRWIQTWTAQLSLPASRAYCSLILLAACPASVPCSILDFRLTKSGVAFQYRSSARYSEHVDSKSKACYAHLGYKSRLQQQLVQYSLQLGF